MICMNYNFNVFVLHKMYFQNYFTNSSVQLQSFTGMYNICVRVVSDVTLSPLARLYASDTTQSLIL